MPEGGFNNEEFRRSFGLPGLSGGIKGPQKGILGALEYLSYPSYALSEATQAVAAGEGLEGAIKGIGRGLTGRRKYPTLGEYLFPKAERPGLDEADIAALGVDILVDPLVWFGPGIAKAALKPVSKLILAGGSKLVPNLHKVLKTFPEKEYLVKEFGGMGGDVKSKAIALTKELELLEMSPAEALKRVLRVTPEGLLPPEFEKVLTKTGTLPAKMPAKLETLNEDMLDIMRVGLRAIDANFRPGEMTLLQKGVQELATRWAPAGAALKYFGGKPGWRTAKMYDDAMASTRIREATVLERFERIVRGQSTADLKRAVAVMEAKPVPGEITPKVQQLADDMTQLLDDHFDDLVGIEEVTDK
jgi:hypothetical protein